MRHDLPEQEPFSDLLSQAPCSFLYDGKPSRELLAGWTQEHDVERLDANRIRYTTRWTGRETGLRVRCEMVQYTDFPALDWVFHFENTGTADTPILEQIQALAMALPAPANGSEPARLHRTNGAPSNPTDFEVAVVELAPGHTEHLGGGGGRSSNKDFPFFKIEIGDRSWIVAVGWSGQWHASIAHGEDQQLHLSAGLELTHFRLHPGEQVRSPRILLLHWEGDTRESNAQFRQLITKHYVALRGGEKPLPTLYCNTCFTRGGGWLNECNAENQISLIRAYAPLGLEALLTDAGWFEGGWPAGAGNWTPRRDAYPDGMAPVAQAAQDHGMIYGLWFEPERVVAGTALQTEHPEWLLHPGDPNPGTYLLNFGLPEVQDFMFGIVQGFMDLPGFGVYRQDFNMDPLPYWRASDTPDRQGITEIRYIEGLYAYWERIAETWPESLRIECASGGRRIDLETIMRMHVHQKSDYWFDNEVDQASIWGLSQYLPNNVFMAPLNRMDPVSFHSAFATSLCMGWIADAPDFDVALGQQLLNRYREWRHLLTGAWYPLLPYTRDASAWIASQYHRPDLGEGMLLIFRHAESPSATVNLTLQGLEPEAQYTLHHTETGARTTATGAALMAGFTITLSERPSSELIVLRKMSAAEG